MRRSLRAAAFLAAALVAALIPALASPASAATATVTVGGPTGQPLTLQLSTNNVWSGLVDQTAPAKQSFDALSLPLVRLHVGDDGYPAAMPEIKQGEWSFAALDALVNDETSIGQQPLMNIKFAPDWMWTCYPNSTGVNGSQGTGTVADSSFQTFASYMARLVAYYNQGSMTTESGNVISNPAGKANRVTYWELWNEPDLNNETPCAPPSGVALTPSEYVTMWNAVTAAMLKVDPALRFVGPATAGGQFGSGPGNDYVTALMNGAATKPYAVSFHAYGYWDNTVPDATLFDGDSAGAGGIASTAAAAAAIHTQYPDVPIWITEGNVNADWGADPAGRPWGPLGAAWWASSLISLAGDGVQLLHQYDVADGPQFGLIDDQSGAPRLPYWELKTLNAAFPPGSQPLAVTTSGVVQAMAAHRPDGKVTVLVVDRQVDSATTVGGAGQPLDVTVDLTGVAPKSVTVTQIDASTNPSTGPAATAVPVAGTVQVHLPGFGFAVVTADAGRAPADVSAPTVSLTGPASVSLTRNAAFRWAATDTDSGVASYDVRRRSASVGTGLSAWMAPSAWQNVTFTSVALAVSPGQQVCVEVRARDRAGNVSGWTQQGCVARPADDRGLSASVGWSRRTGSRYFLGTYTTSTRHGASLGHTVSRVAAVALLATRCPACGSVAVYVGSTRIAAFNLHATTTRRQLLRSGVGRARSGTLRVVVTSSNRTVQVDGLALLHS